MAKFSSSIFTRFIIYAGLYLVLVAVVAVTGVLSLREAGRNTAVLAGTWSDGATLLSDIEYNLAALRVAEVTRGLTQDKFRQALAEANAWSKRQTINQLVKGYETRLAGQTPPEFFDFADRWARYQDMHDAWLRAGATQEAARMNGPGGVLDQSYWATDATIDRVIEIHQAEGEASARNVARLMWIDNVVMGVCAVTALLFSAFILFRFRVDIIRPLSAITRAMAELAAGNRETELPGRERQDEIGEMAASCEVFRLNVVALDHAHEAARRAEEQAQLLARHDALTGLPNRRVFAADLETALARAEKGNNRYALLLIDLDDFKKVNDIQGHQAGDAVLCEVAHRLETAVRKSDTLARLGGDEFAIITQGGANLHEHQEHTKRLAARLLGLIRQPIAVGDGKVEIGASIGIASFAATAAGDVTSLLRAADIAMYRAKQSGRYTFRFFEQSMDDEMRAREALERDVAQAIADGSIRPYYQALVDIGRQRIRGFEALARWDHPVRGMVTPGQFIPIVEQLGLTGELSGAILRQICRDARGWPEEICIAINVSPFELKDETMPARFARILQEEGMAPQRLEVEITESALISDMAAAKTILAALQAQGITLSLDDFGTGYSSLYHLRELRFDKVKIDRSFVQAMRGNAESENIIDAILGLTGSLHLPAVAEGIEDAATLRMLTAKGCALGQGFYFGKAMPAAAASALLQHGMGAVPA